jgi:hypothetical protein
MYFNKMLAEVKSDNNPYTRITKIINPFSLCYLCNYYLGDECDKCSIPLPPDKKELLTNLELIKDYEIIHVEFNYFCLFCNEILDKIDKKIILTTGQWHGGPGFTNDLIIKILEHPNILLWVSQNPICTSNEKYMGFPYGIHHNHLESLVHILLEHKSIKTKEVTHLFTHITHSSRKLLPVVPEINLYDFFIKIAESKYLISPVGDRPDTYRHYESIALGAIPVSNINKELYECIFENNMYYTTIEEMVIAISNNSISGEYFEPNKDLICFDYYKDKVLERIKKMISI